jgi:hypothetical protein
MAIQVNLSALRHTKWHEYLLRFVFGGGVCVLAGIVAHRFGPVVGGIFLAIPAIFPASATLIEKHEEEKTTTQKGHKNRANPDAEGQMKVGFDAEGAALGSIGLVVFALVMWKFMPGRSASLVLFCATLSWLLVATTLWKIQEMFSGHQKDNISPPAA